MKVSAITSRRLADLKDRLPPEDIVAYSEHILKGGDRELWLLQYEKKLRGQRVIKDITDE